MLEVEPRIEKAQDLVITASPVRPFSAAIGLVPCGLMRGVVHVASSHFRGPRTCVSAKGESASVERCATRGGKYSLCFCFCFCHPPRTNGQRTLRVPLYM
jgi:hypothetical protein